MKSTILTEIEERIDLLSIEEQLWLVEELTHRLVENALQMRYSIEEQMVSMGLGDKVNTKNLSRPT